MWEGTGTGQEATEDEKAKQMLIRKAAVIGAGTMGCGIATHLANAGVACLLLDIVS